MRKRNIAMLVAMAEKGLTNRALAHTSAVHPITISLLRNQRVDPKADTAERVAAALDKTPAELGWALDRKEVPQ